MWAAEGAMFRLVRSWVKGSQAAITGAKIAKTMKTIQIRMPRKARGFFRINFLT